jgi:hypothetical protein
MGLASMFGVATLPTLIEQLTDGQGNSLDVAGCEMLLLGSTYDPAVFLDWLIRRFIVPAHLVSAEQGAATAVARMQVGTLHVLHQFVQFTLRDLDIPTLSRYETQYSAQTIYFRPQSLNTNRVGWGLPPYRLWMFLDEVVMTSMPELGSAVRSALHWQQRCHAAAIKDASEVGCAE